VVTSTIRILDQSVAARCICDCCDQPAVSVEEWKTESMPAPSFRYACADHSEKLVRLGSTFAPLEPSDMALDVYTVEPGRNIYRNGDPAICIDCRNIRPTEADDLTHVICALLNERQPKKGERS
jgi:hypothetical protein